MGEEVDGKGSSKENIPLRDIASSTKSTMSGDLRDTEEEHITVTLGRFETTSLHRDSFLEGNYQIVYKQRDKVTDRSIGVLLKAVHRETGHILTLMAQPRLLDSTNYYDILKKTQDQSYSDRIQKAVPLIKSIQQRDVDADKTDFFVGSWTVSMGSQKIYSYIQSNIDGRACFQLPTSQQPVHYYQMWNAVTMVMYYRHLTNERDLSFSIFTVDGNSCNARLVDLNPSQTNLKRVVFNYTPTDSATLLPDQIFSFKMEDNTSLMDSPNVGKIMYATLDQVRWYLTYDVTQSQDGIVSVMATTCKQEAKRFYFIEPPF